jgi:uncharacterized protein
MVRVSGFGFSGLLVYWFIGLLVYWLLGVVMLMNKAGRLRSLPGNRKPETGTGTGPLYQIDKSTIRQRLRFIITVMRILVLMLVLMLFLAGCAPTGPQVRPDPADDGPVGVERMLDAGDYRAAAEGWMELAEDHPERAGLYRVRAAEAWLLAGEPDLAGELLDDTDPQQLDRTGQARFDLARAELAMLRGDMGMAGWLLAHAGEDLPPALAERHQILERRLQQLESQPARQALAALEESMADGDFEPELALALLIEYPLEALENIVYEFGHRVDLLPWLDLVISAREHLLDDPALQTSLAAWEERHPLAGYTADEAMLWIAAWRQTIERPARIAVALPGPDTALYRAGMALREGLVAAWLDIMPASRPELSFHYVGGEPEDIIATWFDAREQGADMLVGPLDRAQVIELMALPDAGMLPTLLLNVPDDRTSLHETSGIAALALPPEEEAELAAIRALVDGHQRAVVFAQYTSWGDRVARSFVDTFRLGGGQILEHRGYDPANSDHSALLRETLKVEESEQRAAQLARLLNEPIESVAQRRTDLDLIFLGARANDGRQLRPQLRFFDAGDVPLMATSHIVAGAPDPERDRDLDGVVIPISPWFLDSTRAGELRTRAERQYEFLSAPALSRLHALGRDAMTLTAWTTLMSADPHLYLPGMTGRLTMPDGRIVSRDLPFIRIDNGRARPH